VSLIKRLMMTPEKLAANRANGPRSQGPATPEGLERVREANTLHGYYSKVPRETMRALGENPEDFDRLLESLNRVWNPQNSYEQSLVRRLARLMWRLDRTDRVQEAMTVYQVENLERNIERQDEEDTVRHKIVTAALERLLKAGEYRDFATAEGHWHDFEELYGDNPEKLPAGRPRKIWLRLAPLVRPEQLDPAARERSGVALADEARRGQARAELRSLLRQEIDDKNQAYRERRDERAREISPAFRDAYMMPSHSRLQVLLRAEDSAFNQMRHVTDMLVRLKAQRRMEAKQATRNLQDEGESHDVNENKGSGSESAGESHDVGENK
jgi:hypothetical protein